MTIATLTSKGQITIPKDIRQHFKLQAGDRLEFVWVGEELRVRLASRKVDEVFGKYRKAKQKPVTVETMNAAIAERFAKDTFWVMHQKS